MQGQSGKPVFDFDICLRVLKISAKFSCSAVIKIMILAFSFYYFSCPQSLTENGRVLLFSSQTIEWINTIIWCSSNCALLRLSFKFLCEKSPTWNPNQPTNKPEHKPDQKNPITLPTPGKVSAHISCSKVQQLSNKRHCIFYYTCFLLPLQCCESSKCQTLCSMLYTSELPVLSSISLRLLVC